MSSPSIFETWSFENRSLEWIEQEKKYSEHNEKWSIQEYVINGFQVSCTVHTAYRLSCSGEVDENLICTALSLCHNKSSLAKCFQWSIHSSHTTLC